jgi:MFS family permease
VISILIQPTVGSISDYTGQSVGAGGKPYIVIGSLLDVGLLDGIALSSSILMLGAFGACSPSARTSRAVRSRATCPDLVPEKQVGLASAMVGLMQILGNVTGFVLVTVAVLGGQIELAIFAVAIVELVTMAAVVLRVGEGQPPKPRNGKSWGTIAREVWGTDVLKERSYVWLLASRFFFLMGGAVLVNLISRTSSRPTTSGRTLPTPPTLCMLVTIVIANVIAIIPSARISDRIGRKPVIYASCVIGFIGIVLAALAPAVPLAIVGGALFGASAGTFLAVDWALMT